MLIKELQFLYFCVFHTDYKRKYYFTIYVNVTISKSAVDLTWKNKISLMIFKRGNF